MAPRFWPTLALGALVACGSNRDEAPAEVSEPAAPSSETQPAPLVATDLAPVLPGTIAAPEGARVRPGLGTAAEVDLGDHFAVWIDDTPVNLPERRQEIADNTINRLTRFLVDTPDTLLYESQATPGEPEFHLLTNVDVGGATWSCQDQKGPLWTEPQARQMLQSCHSLRRRLP